LSLKLSKIKYNKVKYKEVKKKTKGNRLRRESWQFGHLVSVKGKIKKKI